MIDRYHFVGILGAGMSALAKLLKDEKTSVSGSDTASSPIEEELKQLGIPVYFGHKEGRVQPKDIVVFSSSIQKDNVEVAEARKLGCTVWHRSDVLSLLTQRKKSLLVAGTHGKTTTSALLTHILTEAKLSPEYAIGAKHKNLGSNARKGEGPYFVAEADESDGTLTKYFPYGLILLNCDTDHIDHYGSLEALLNTYVTLAKQVSSSERLVYFGDDPHFSKKGLQGFTFGLSKECDYRASNIRPLGFGSCFDIVYEGKKIVNLFFPAPGKHNVLNALSVFALCHRLGLDGESMVPYFSTFELPERRLERFPDIQKVSVIEDYAHHPREVEAVLEAMKDSYPDRRLIVVFQPHRLSRMKLLKESFDTCFQKADRFFLAPLFTAGESERDENFDCFFSARMQLNYPETFNEAENLLQELLSIVKPFDVALFLGAGDIYSLRKEFMERLSPRKLKAAVIKGGIGCEHKISLQSARFIESCFSRETYELVSFEITEEGTFIQEGKGGRLFSEVVAELQQMDVVFPVLHGQGAEDGVIPHLCTLLKAPCVGPSAETCVVTMNKVYTKALLASSGIPVVPFFSFDAYTYKVSQKKILQEIMERFRLPFFLKAPHLGSSFGVIKVEEEDSLVSAIEQILALDTIVLVEEFMFGREIEFAVIGSNPSLVFPPGEILTCGKVYDFSGKYGENSISVSTKAKLSKSLEKEGIALVKRVVSCLQIEGMSRVDCFLDREGRYFVNEVNPIPGFTENSLFPLLCMEGGMQKEEIIDKLVKDAMIRFQERNQRMKMQVKVAHA